MPSKATLEFLKENGIADEPAAEEQETTAQPSVLSMLIDAQAQGTLTEDVLKQIGELLTSKKNKSPEWLIQGKNGYTVNEPLFIKSFCADRDLHNINGVFYDVSGTVSETALKRDIQHRIQDYIVTNLARKTENIYKALEISVSADNYSPNLREIHLLNGVLNVDGTFTNEKRFCLNRLQIAYNPNAPQPQTFTNCLLEMFEPDDILTLQEYMGYCLIPETAAQKCLSVIGSGGEGKSTVIGTALKTIFEGNIVCEGIDKLATDKFILNDIENKLVYFDDDIKAEKLSDTSMIKKIATNKGRLHIEGKFKSRHSGNVYTRVIMFGNNCLQALYDTSNGFFRRQLIIQTKPKTREESQDKSNISQMIQNEIQGIFNWCFEGLQRLIHNDFKFTQSEKSKQALENLKNESFNFVEFLHEQVEFGADFEISTADLVGNYKIWCSDNVEIPLKDRTITNYLASHQEELKLLKCYVYKSNKKIRGYKGLKMRTLETMNASQSNK